MRDGGADYVVRLSAKALRLTDAQGAPLDRAALCRRAQAEAKDGGGPLDITVRVLPGGQGSKGGAALDARLICLPPPPAQAESARRTMRANARKWGYTPTDAALDTATCFMLITALDADTYPPTRILDLYRRRWQGERAFKRLKPLLGLENLRVVDPGMASTWIHAVQLVALLIDLNRPGAQDEGPDSPPLGAVDPIPGSRSAGDAPAVPLWRVIALAAAAVWIAILAAQGFGLNHKRTTLQRIAEPPRRRITKAKIS